MLNSLGRSTCFSRDLKLYIYREVSTCHARIGDSALDLEAMPILFPYEVMGFKFTFLTVTSLFAIVERFGVITLGIEIRKFLSNLACYKLNTRDMKKKQTV